MLGSITWFDLLLSAFSLGCCFKEPALMVQILYPLSQGNRYVRHLLGPGERSLVVLHVRRPQLQSKQHVVEEDTVVWPRLQKLDVGRHCLQSRNDSIVLLLDSCHCV